MDYSQLSDQEINMLVAKIQHPDKDFIDSKTRPPSVVMLNHINMWIDYCNNPADAWQIIVDNEISLNSYGSAWEASFEHDAPIGAFGTDETVTSGYEHRNPLRAAMIAFLMKQEQANA